MRIKKGDIVKVITGGYKGKTGKVLKVLTKENRVIVEGVNIVSRHSKPSNANPDGGIIKKEAPIHISNVPRGLGDVYKRQAYGRPENQRGDARRLHRRRREKGPFREKDRQCVG